MQARRLLLFIGILMLLAVVAASLVSPPDEAQDGQQEETDGTEAVERPPPFRADAGEPVEVEFVARPPRDDRGAGRTGGPGTPGAGPTGGDRPAAPTRKVRDEKHVVVTVSTPQPGQVELEGLGLLQTATPDAPAVFDLYTDSPGTYPVLYTPADGVERQIGVLMVEEAPADRGGG